MRIPGAAVPKQTVLSSTSLAGQRLLVCWGLCLLKTAEGALGALPMGGEQMVFGHTIIVKNFCDHCTTLLGSAADKTSSNSKADQGQRRKGG